MNQLIEKNIEEITRLCKKHHVSELLVFGSILSDAFTDQSDVDFAVLFEENLTPIEYGECFLGMLADLEALLTRKVDLISYRVIKNPVFKETLDKTKVTLYAA